MHQKIVILSEGLWKVNDQNTLQKLVLRGPPGFAIGKPE